jgi:hypothetical protein
VAFDIKADGAWQGQIDAPGKARAFDGQNANGTGDDVLNYAGNPGTAHITFDGSTDFVVRSYASNGAVDELVNKPGPYDDSVDFPGPALVQVNGQGNWTIAVG